MYIKIHITEDMVLLANPNCPIKLLYNYIQKALVETYNSAINAKKDADALISGTVETEIVSIPSDQSIEVSSESKTKIEPSKPIKAAQESKLSIVAPSQSLQSVRQTDPVNAFVGSIMSIKALPAVKPIAESIQSIQVVGNKKPIAESIQSIQAHSVKPIAESIKSIQAHSVKPIAESIKSIQALPGRKSIAESNQSLQVPGKSSIMASKQSVQVQSQESIQGVRQSKSIMASKQSITQNNKSVVSIVSKQKSSTSKKSLTKTKPKSSLTSESLTDAASVTSKFKELPADQEFDLCDENGKLKQIYNFGPSVNGWESGHFISRATYIVVLFEGIENGVLIKPVPMIPRSHQRYSELCLKVRRQSLLTTPKPSVEKSKA